MELVSGKVWTERKIVVILFLRYMKKGERAVSEKVT